MRVRRVWQVGWKLAVVTAIGSILVYKLAFAPVAVRSYQTAEGPITVEVMGTGTLEARVQATISAKISGRIAQVLADQGDRVREGQLLATLDDGDLQQQVEISRAELAIAQASVDRTEAEIARAEATANLARLERERTAQMRHEAAATEHELSVANERYSVAAADLERAQLARVEAERQVLKAREDLQYYEERLDDTRIISPFDGLVILRSREQGDIVVPGSAILQVIRTDRMWVSAWVDETMICDLSVGQRASVVFRSQPDQSYEGSVARLGSQTDRETREFVVDVTVNRDGEQGRSAVGATACDRLAGRQVGCVRR